MDLDVDVELVPCALGSYYWCAEPLRERQAGTITERQALAGRLGYRAAAASASCR
jgi:hypothetical protein